MPLADDSDENTSILPWLEKFDNVSVKARGGTRGLTDFSNKRLLPLPVTSQARHFAAVVTPTSKSIVSVLFAKLSLSPMPQAIARATLPALFSTSHKAPSDPVAIPVGKLLAFTSRLSRDFTFKNRTAMVRRIFTLNRHAVRAQLTNTVRGIFESGRR